MFIGTCVITLYLPVANSLKEKRSVVKSLTARVHNEFNVSIAEIDSQDVWQQAVLGVACISASQSYARGQLEAVVRFIEKQRPDISLVNYVIDML